MGTMTAKHINLANHHTSIAGTNIDTLISQLGAPEGDAFKFDTYGDKRFEIVKNLADVVVGDIAIAGNMKGKVTAILDDGEGSPADNRIQVTFSTPYMQTPNASSVSDHVVTYSFVDNDEASADGKSKVYYPGAVSGRGVLFVKEIQAVATDENLTTLTAADGAATANGVETEAITLTVKDNNGVQHKRGGLNVVLSATGDAVLSAVTDNNDGTYSATITNGTAETSTVSANINGVDIDDTVDVVFS